MWIIIAVFSAIIFGAASIIMKAATIKKLSDYHVLWGLYLSGSIFLFFSTPDKLDCDINLLIAAIFIAMGSFFGNYFVIKALDAGPASLTAPMLNLNIPLIIIMSIVFYGESITLLKILIILLLIIAITLIKFDPSEKMSIKDKKWFIWVIAGSIFLFLREGGLKITLEMGLNNQLVLFYSYLLCLTLSTIMLYQKNQKLSIMNYKIHSKAVMYGLYAGICSGSGLFLYSTALSTGPASIVALIFSARSIVIILISTLLFKEQLSKFQKISVSLLCIGLSLTSFMSS